MSKIQHFEKGFYLHSSAAKHPTSIKTFLVFGSVMRQKLCDVKSNIIKNQNGGRPHTESGIWLFLGLVRTFGGWKQNVHRHRSLEQSIKYRKFKTADMRRFQNENGYISTSHPRIIRFRWSLGAYTYRAPRRVSRRKVEFIIWRQFYFAFKRQTKTVIKQQIQM